MAKAAIRKLKDRRFWRWLCCEVYGSPAPKQPIKQRRYRVRLRRKHFERAWRQVERMLEEYRHRSTPALPRGAGEGDEA